MQKFYQEKKFISEKFSYRKMIKFVLEKKIYLSFLFFF